LVGARPQHEHLVFTVRIDATRESSERKEENDAVLRPAHKERANLLSKICNPPGPPSSHGLVSHAGYGALGGRCKPGRAPRPAPIKTLKPSQFFSHKAFLIPAAALWAALAAAVAVDALRTRRATGTTARLHTAVGGVIALYALSSTVAVLAATAAPSPPWWASATAYAAIGSEDVAEAAFIALLLAIATGFGITRAASWAALGPHRRRVLAVPLVYLTTSLVVDLTEEAVERAGRGEAAGGGGGLGSLVFNTAEIVSLVALLLAWLFIFDAISRAREELEGAGEGMVGAARGGGGAPAVTASAAPGSGGGGGIVITGAAVPLPPAAAAAVAAGEADPSTMYARLHGGGTAAAAASGDATAAPATVADAVARAGKVRLLRRFRAGVTGYVLLRAAAIVVPLLLLAEPGEEAAAVTGVLVAEGAVRLAFLACLALLFRPVPDSPYLLLDEDEGRGSGNGDAREGGDDPATARASASLSTELGVLSTAPARAGPLDARPMTARLVVGPRSDAAPPPGARAAVARPTSSPDPRFVLDDGGGDGWEGGGGREGAGGGVSRPGGRPKRVSSTEEVPL